MQKVFIILLAGGLGKRFDPDSKRPKQFVTINRRPILYYSVKTALKITSPENIRIVYPIGYLNQFESICSKYNWKIRLVEGGEKRQDSAFNAFKSIQNNKGNVLIHDCARPLASYMLFQKIISELKIHKACVPIVKSSDTVKLIKNNYVEKTLDRDTLGLVQTPQGFDIQTLKKAYKNMDKFAEYTDESSIVENAGIKPKVIEGEKTNLKLTLKTDLDIIKAFLKGRL